MMKKAWLCYSWSTTFGGETEVVFHYKEPDYDAWAKVVEIAYVVLEEGDLPD